MCEGKGEVPGVRANVTWKKAVLISKEVEAQSCSLPRVVWVCSRQSQGQRDVESVTGDLHRSATLPRCITSSFTWFVMVLVD